MRVRAPTISLRNRATASAWSLGGEIFPCRLQPFRGRPRRAPRCGLSGASGSLLCRGITVGGNRRGRGSGSARVKGPAGKSADLHARPWRRDRHECSRPRARPGCRRERRAGGARDVAVANMPPVGRRGGPAPQGDPRALRGGPHERQRTHARAAPPPRWPRPGPQERARDPIAGRGRTAAAPTAPGARPACTRRRDWHLVPPRAHARSSPGPPRPRGAPYLALARPVAVNRQLAAVRPTLAAPHPRHRAGRTSDGDGIFECQDLTSSPLRQIFSWLRFSKSLGARREGVLLAKDRLRVTFCRSAPCRCLRLRADDDGGSEPAPLTASDDRDHAAARSPAINLCARK